MLSRTEGMNEQLLKEVNSLRKERGMSVIELNSVANQVDDLNRTSQLGRVAGQDLHHVLQLIEAAIKEGTLKVGVVSLLLLERTCGCGLLLRKWVWFLASVSTVGGGKRSRWVWSVAKQTCGCGLLLRNRVWLLASVHVCGGCGLLLPTYFFSKILRVKVKRQSLSSSFL